MDDKPLAGKAALITGAARRIGRATALALADAGADIVIHYNTSADEADSLRLELLAKGVSAYTLKADFRHAEEYTVLVDRAHDAAGRLDILVNNASIFPAETLEDATFDSLVRNMEVNAWVPFYLTRAFAQSVGHGHVVNMLDSRLSGYDWKHVGYIVSKDALAVFTRMAALAYAPGVRVNAVAPGLILPPPGKDISYIEALVGTVPLKEHGEPEQIARAIRYLVTSEFITGEIIFVDGGRHLKEYTSG